MAMMISIVTLTTSGALLWLTQGLRFDGVKIWAWGLLVYAVALQVLSQRAIIPEPIAILLGYGLLALTLSLMQWGVYRFFNQPVCYVLLIGPAFVLPLLLVFFLHDAPMRVVLSNVVFAAQLFLMIRMVFCHRHLIPGRGCQLLLIGCSIGCVMCLMRVFWIVFWKGPTPIAWGPGSLQSTSFIGSMVTVLLDSLGIIGMVKERADAHHRLLALSDALTGVANRRAILDELQQRLLEASRYKTPLSLLMLDIDYFKRINDTHGHLVGDGVLQHLAQLVLKRIRATDTLGRYGGEEFLVVLPHTSPEQGLMLAEMLCQHIREAFVDVRGLQLSITTSIGVAGMMPFAQETVEGLIHRADEALYRAKTEGRDRVILAITPDIPFGGVQAFG